ncbi:hypothetical protein M0R19_08165 [Candidatus Pacearchaeota archaeon]|jgi:hypothetical protein|nr:hypothetical protein [bacterium]MCK9597132.1 hypothetical protein [Candidatus Pacearchaeota archaeon]
MQNVFLNLIEEKVKEEKERFRVREEEIKKEICSYNIKKEDGCGKLS